MTEKIMNPFLEKKTKIDEYDEEIIKDQNDKQIINVYHKKFLKDINKQQNYSKQKDNDQVELNEKFDNLDLQIIFSNPIRRIYYQNSIIPPLIEDMEGMKSFNMKDYYVNLKTVIKDNDEQIGFDEVGGEKTYIDIDDIFNSEEQNSGLKILILGGAGVGKSTLMQYMAYQWSSNYIWKNKFDAVFRVQLKTLLTNNWKQRYLINPTYSLEIEKIPLKYLIHYNLISISEQNKQNCQVQVEDININQSKVALLLDGYDEVTHLFEDPTFSKIQEEIFQQQYVILTSRPNAITDQFKKKFNLTIENTGLDKQGVSQYIDQYFAQEKKLLQKKQRLEELLERNQSIQSICHIPVNLAMLCYLYSEQQEEISSFSFHSAYQLYKEVIKKLGERFISKDFNGVHQERQTLLQKVTSQLKKLPELRAIRYIAYMGLTGGGIEIEESNRKETLIINTYQDRKSKNCASIEESIDNLNLQTNANKIIKFGLLKQEGPKNDNTSYSFIHLSFQEYLTAEYLMQKLILGVEKEKNNVLHYLSQHRNEPRLLLTLKFLSGLVSEQDNKVVVEQFWSTMNCNVDGVLEFSLQEKVKLLMSLLGSAIRIDESNCIQIDKRIPHLNEINILINALAISNLNQFRLQLKDSNYSSYIITSVVEQLLQGEDNRLELLQSMKGLFFKNYTQNSSLQGLEIHKNRNLQEIIQYIYEESQSQKILAQQHSKTQIENDKDLQIDHFNMIQQGLSISWFIPQKVNQKILMKSIFSVLESNQVLESQKFQALSIINMLLQNQKIDDHFCEKIFEYIINFEINYQKSILEISQKFTENNFWEILKKQDDPRCCLYCEIDRAQEKIFYKESETLYEMMLQILKRLSSLNLKQVLNWIQQIIRYQLHYQSKQLPQVFSFLKYLFQDKNKAQQLDEHHVQQIKLIIYSLIFHFDRIDNFHQIWKEFNQQMKDILVTNIISYNSITQKGFYWTCMHKILESIKGTPLLINLIKETLRIQNQAVLTGKLLMEYENDSSLIEEICIILIEEELSNLRKVKYFKEINKKPFQRLNNIQTKEQKLGQAINIYFSYDHKQQNWSDKYRYSFNFIFGLREIKQIDNFSKNLLYSIIVHIIENCALKYTETDLSKEKIFQLLESNQIALERYLESLFLQDGEFHLTTLNWLTQIICIQDNNTLLKFYGYFLNKFFNYYFKNENKIQQLDQKALFEQIHIRKISTLELELIYIFSPFFKVGHAALFPQKQLMTMFQENQINVIQKFLVCQFAIEERNRQNEGDEAKQLLSKLKIDYFENKDVNASQKSMVQIKYLQFLLQYSKKINIKEEFNAEKMIMKLNILTKYLKLYFQFIKNDEYNQIENSWILEIIKEQLHIILEQPQMYDSIIDYIENIVESISNNDFKSTISFEIYKIIEFLIQQNVIQSKKLLELRLLANIQQDEFKCGMIKIFQQLISKLNFMEKDIELFNLLLKILSLTDSFKQANNFYQFADFIQNQLLKDQSQLLNQISIIITNSNNKLHDKMIIISRLSELFVHRKVDIKVSAFLEEKYKLIMNQIKENPNLFLEIKFSYIGSFLSLINSQQNLEFIINYLNELIDYFIVNQINYTQNLFKYFQEEKRNEEEMQIILSSILEKLQYIIESNNDVKIKQIALDQIKNLIPLLKKDEKVSNVVKKFMQSMLNQQNEDILNIIFSKIFIVTINLIPEEEGNKFKLECQDILQQLLKLKDFNLISYLSLQINDQMIIEKFKKLIIEEKFAFQEYQLRNIFDFLIEKFSSNQQKLIDFTFNEASPEIFQKFRQFYLEYLKAFQRKYAFITLIQKQKKNIISFKQLVEEYKLLKQKYYNQKDQKDVELIEEIKQFMQMAFRFYSQDQILDMALHIISFENEENSQRKELISEAKILLKSIIENIEENDCHGS